MEEKEESNEELFLSLLPDIPLTLHKSSQDNTVRLDLNAAKRGTYSTPRRAITMRIRKPQTTAMIYTNGDSVCTGTKSKEQLWVAIRRYACILQKLGFPVSVFNFKIQNIITTCYANPVGLERLVVAHPQHCSYEAELFCGLIFKVTPGITVTISNIASK